MQNAGVFLHARLRNSLAAPVWVPAGFNGLWFKTFGSSVMVGVWRNQKIVNRELLNETLLHCRNDGATLLQSFHKKQNEQQSQTEEKFVPAPWAHRRRCCDQRGLSGCSGIMRHRSKNSRYRPNWRSPDWRTGQSATIRWAFHLVEAGSVD